MACRTFAGEQPDAIIVSTGLWHMLHIGEIMGYTEAVKDLTNLSESLVDKQVCTQHK